MKAHRVKTIVILGTLDTKGLEVGFIRDKLNGMGFKTIVVDDGVLDKPRIRADIRRDEVAKAGGKKMEELIEMARKGSDRADIIEVMTEGAVTVIKQLYSQGKIDGIFSLGGSMGFTMGAKVMKALPIGIPKLLLATHLYPNAVREADITIMLSPTDIMGLNPIMIRMLSCAAGAIAGMVKAQPLKKKTKPLIGITAAGVTTPGVMKLQSHLQNKGYDNVVFHAHTYFLDQLVREGVIDGIIDFTPYELTGILTTPATADSELRLKTAELMGIPQLIVPGGLDMIVMRKSKDEVLSIYKNRKLYMHNPSVTAVRTTKGDLAKLAKVISDKANRSTGPVAVVIPLRGLSEIDKEGKAFYEPETDRHFALELRKRLKKHIIVKEVGYHVNDEQFVEVVTNIYDLISKGALVDE